MSAYGGVPVLSPTAISSRSSARRADQVCIALPLEAHRLKIPAGGR
jgi:hypothetical protein